MKKFKNLPAGSTIVLSTTSPDKRAEYETMFKRFDVNFIFLDDLGLSPQKTDEMTNTYGGNLMQKACEVSLALHQNMDAIKERLAAKGYDIARPIVGMVEDSGIEIYPKDKKLRDNFNQRFREKIEHKIYYAFEQNPKLRERSFSRMSDDEIDSYLYNVLQNTRWMTDIGTGNTLPGPNFKPIMEALRGGMREIFDTMYETLESMVNSAQEKRDVRDVRQLRFRNHCAMMIVEPHADPLRHVSAEDIVEGQNKGWLKSQKELNSLMLNRSNPKAAHLKMGDFFTGDMLIPDGQVETSNLSQMDLIRSGMLFTKHNKRASYYRLEAIGKLKDKYDLPIAPKYEYTSRVENTEPLKVMVLHGGKDQPKLAGLLNKQLKSAGYTVLAMPSDQDLLNNPNALLMSEADVAIIMPGEDSSEVENASVLLGATVDKQVMPKAKEKTILVLNPKDETGKGHYDTALAMLRHTKIAGLKNGVAEVDDVAECNIREYANAAGALKLFGDLQQRLENAARRKAHRLTDIAPIQIKKDIAPQNIPSVNPEHFSIFVAGGAANEYPEYKAPANQLGRYIYQQGWTLVTGAGQKDGPMGAVHSGFVEAFLTEALKPQKTNKALAKVREIVDRSITDICTQRHLTGIMGTQYRNEVMHAIFENPDAEYLVHEAPELLLKLLQPEKKSKIYDAIGSLKERGTLLGYSMPPLLISEGSGKWPMGMQGHNAGNMQRRMHEMLQASAHVFLTGGQGTYQELVESVRIAVQMNQQRREAGLEPKPICVLDQPTYKQGIYKENGTVFRPVLDLIREDLQKAGLSEADIGLTTFTNLREMELHLRHYQLQFWDGKKEATILR